MQYLIKAAGGIGLLLMALTAHAQSTTEDFYGTTEPFASEAIYFLLTDRFANGDTGNDHRDQGKAHGNDTWERRLNGPDGQVDFIGYTGGDFKGVYDNADYIKNMGFTAVWISPIVDNPDESFTGGTPVQFGAGVGSDGGKTGYHGYWGVNFFQVDEHWESPGFTFREFTQKMHQDHGLKIVLDIVGNHGSPSWDMKPVDQPKFGEIYDETGNLIADHQNLQPNQLDPVNNPLHRFFNKSGNLAQLSDLNENNTAVLDYLVEAYLKWIEQGADAFRVDTIAWMPDTFWKQFSDRIRARHPGFFMFGENFDFNASTIARHQRPENGGISVLDFPGKNSIVGVFQNENSNFADIQGYLHLSDCVYTNPYELATFYDNHDMARMNASENGFIDAHNWLFTARGIPVVYYGSEMRFMAGKAEHSGNRNPYGKANMDSARNGAIYRKLAQVAAIRKGSVALQKGLQENLQFQGQTAAFYRVYQKDGVNQTALVLLNKGASSANFRIDKYLSAGTWTDAATNSKITVAPDNRVISTSVDAHSVKVLLFNDKMINEPQLIARLQQAMQSAKRCQQPPVEVTPEPLVAGKEVTVSYYRAGSDAEVALHWGINNWSGTSTPQGEVKMTFNQGKGAHEVTLTLPANATQFDFVFHLLTPPPARWENNGGKDWHYRVEREDGPPLPPTGLSAAAGDRSVELRWAAADGATAYTLYYTDDGADPTRESAKLTPSAGRTQFSHTGLINGNTYTYRISASNARGESELSTPAVAAIPNPVCKTRFGDQAVLRLTGQKFANWNPANNDYVLKCISDYVWEAKVVVPETLMQTPYKLTLNGTWTVNWGGGAVGTDTRLDRGGANASVTLNTGTYTLRVTEGSSVDSPVQVQWRSDTPIPMVDVNFTCRNGNTYPGQSVYVIGSVSELGTWDVAKAVKLDTTPASYPSWTGSIKVPAIGEIKWKCLKREERDATRGVEWQRGSDNRLICTTQACPTEAGAGF